MLRGVILNTVADVFCHNFWQIVLFIFGTFWPTFVLSDVIANMLWLMLLPYMNVMADVYAIVDNIGSHLVVLK